MSNGARTGGAVKVVLGIALAAAAFAIVPLDATAHGSGTRARLVYVLGPLLSMIGLTEMLLGIRAQQWAYGWPSLPGWLRFVVTVVAVITLLALVVASIVIAR
jgi:hypothetical protein